MQKYDVSMSKEYLTLLPVEYLFPPKHLVKILWKFKLFPLRYARKREWVFLSEHSVVLFAAAALAYIEKEP